jgi:hypothetical protein
VRRSQKRRSDDDRKVARTDFKAQVRKRNHAAAHTKEDEKDQSAADCLRTALQVHLHAVSQLLHNMCPVITMQASGIVSEMTCNVCKERLAVLMTQAHACRRQKWQVNRTCGVPMPPPR